MIDEILVQICSGFLAGFCAFKVVLARKLCWPDSLGVLDVVLLLVTRCVFGR